MSTAELLHDAYTHCMALNSDESTDLILNASTAEEKEFIRVVTDFALQQKQKRAIAENRF